MKSIESYVGGALVLGALLLFLSGMILRLTTFSASGGWVTELTIYIMAWGILMSAAGCVAHGEHVRADIFLRMVGPGYRYIAEILAALAGFAMCAALAWFGWKVVLFAFAWDERGPSYLQIPTAWFYLALPVSMAACTLRYLAAIVILLREGAGAKTD